jgi:hypothetical protein
VHARETDIKVQCAFSEDQWTISLQEGCADREIRLQNAQVGSESLLSALMRCSGKECCSEVCEGGRWWIEAKGRSLERPHKHAGFVTGPISGQPLEHTHFIDLVLSLDHLVLHDFEIY